MQDILSVNFLIMNTEDMSLPCWEWL